MFLKKPKWAFVYLYAPMLFLILLDYALTMDGHMPVFLGTTQSLRENAPLGRLILAIGPFTFTFSIFLYLAVLFYALMIFKPYYRLILFFAIIFGHGDGALSWLRTGVRTTICASHKEIITCSPGQNATAWFILLAFFILFAAIVAEMVQRYDRVLHTYDIDP